jgi:hypothetical protein
MYNDGRGQFLMKALSAYLFIVLLVLGIIAGIGYRNSLDIAALECMTRYDCEKISRHYMNKAIDLDASNTELDRRAKDLAAALVECRRNQDVAIYKELNDTEAYYYGIYESCLGLIPGTNPTTCNELVKKLYTADYPAHTVKSGGFIWPPVE